MSEWFEDTNVTLIGCDKFNDTKPWLINDQRCCFVLVYAQFCGHCQNLKPEYIKFADKAQFMHVYALDSDQNSNLLKRINEDEKSPFKIRGFPTILIYCNGKFREEYDGERDWQSLLNKAMKTCKEECPCSSGKCSKKSKKKSK